MKILLYLEAEEFLSRSGIGRAMKHQQQALDMMKVDWTSNPNEDYDILHLNTYGPSSWKMLKKAKKAGKKVIFHGHSTEEDFRDSFLGSNLIAPAFKMNLMRFYRAADLVITPTEYSKSLIESYGIKCPIIPVSNGIQLDKYLSNPDKEQIFRDHFSVKFDEKVVICAGLYFYRKGIDDFVKVAKAFPDVKFIWFGYQNLWTIPGKIRRIVKNPPANVLFPGYIKGDVFEGAMTAADLFFFPSREETEGIVVLEALASRQKVLVRDIPVYHGWLDENSANLAKNTDEFISEIHKIFDEKIDKTEIGYQIAQSRALNVVAKDLIAAYQKTMEL